MKQPTFLKSLSHAWDGVCYTIRTQRNARIHIAMGSIVILAAILMNLNFASVGLLVLTIGSVLAAETINTTVEAIVDLLSPEFHDQAKIAKDVAAGAVLIVSITAIVVGLLVFVPPVWNNCSSFFFSPEPLRELSSKPACTFLLSANHFRAIRRFMSRPELL